MPGDGVHLRCLIERPTDKEDFLFHKVIYVQKQKLWELSTSQRLVLFRANDLEPTHHATRPYLSGVKIMAWC